MKVKLNKIAVTSSIVQNPEHVSPWSESYYAAASPFVESSHLWWWEEHLEPPGQED